VCCHIPEKIASFSLFLQGFPTTVFLSVMTTRVFGGFCFFCVGVSFFCVCGVFVHVLLPSLLNDLKPRANMACRVNQKRLFLRLVSAASAWEGSPCTSSAPPKSDFPPLARLVASQLFHWIGFSIDCFSYRAQNQPVQTARARPVCPATLSLLVNQPAERNRGVFYFRHAVWF